MVGILWPVGDRAKVVVNYGLAHSQSVASALFRDIPRRSNSRSLSGFRYERELLMRSAVSRMTAVGLLSRNGVCRGDQKKVQCRGTSRVSRAQGDRTWPCLNAEMPMQCRSKIPGVSLSTVPYLSGAQCMSSV